MNADIFANLVLLIIVLGYAGLCVISPFGPCRRCRGFGYATWTDRRGRLHAGRYCRRCEGTGQRIRLGRHLYNALRRLYRNDR